MSNNPLRDKILSLIDLVAEFQKYGGRIPPGATPDANGWLLVHSIDREDEHPSAALNVGNDSNLRGIYVDHAPTGKGATSFFDLVIRMNAPFMTGNEVYRFYGKQTGVLGEGGAPSVKIGPTLADIETFQNTLTPETKQFLKEKRGLTEDSLAKYRVGWCAKRERNAFPVFDETGTLVNVRFHNSKKEPKTLNWSGYGTARLWGLERLAKAAPGITVLITEGEFDAMLAELPRACDIGAKKNSRGHDQYWRGYKLHLDVADGQIPISAVLTSASVHDSQAAIPLMTMTSQRVQSLYDLMDSAYDADEIHQHSRQLKHVPIIAVHGRRGTKKPSKLPKVFPPKLAPELTWAQQERYKERTMSERVNARLKDEFGAGHIRVRGPVKVMAHLMFGVVSLAVDQWLRLAGNQT